MPEGRREFGRGFRDVGSGAPLATATWVRVCFFSGVILYPTNLRSRRSPAASTRSWIALIRVAWSELQASMPCPVTLVTAADPLEVSPVTGRAALRQLGAALGELDQTRFMSPAWHNELYSELRWSREEALATRDGVDIASLELDAADLAALELVRSASTTELLGRFGLGRALGSAARAAFTTAGAALVVSSPATDRVSMVNGGRGLLRLWLEATAQRIGVHPWGSTFFYQRWREASETLEPWQCRAIASSARTLHEAVPVPHNVNVLLVLRLTTGTRPTARSVRRGVDDVLSFDDVEH